MYMYIQSMRAVTFLFFNCEVLVLGARQHTSSSHAVHCDLRSARNCASSSFQTTSGDGTGLHVQYAACFSLFVCFLSFFLIFFSALAHCFWRADPTRNIEKKPVWPKTYSNESCQVVFSSPNANSRTTIIANYVTNLTLTNWFHSLNRYMSYPLGKSA